MKQYGHIKLSRKFFETDKRWNEKRPRTEVEAWIDLIQMAAWKSTTVRVGGGSTRINRGEFTGSLRTLADRWFWDRTRVRRFLIALEKEGKLVKQQCVQECVQPMKRQVKHLPDVYLLANYDTYQGNAPVSETANETPSETELCTAPEPCKEEAGKQLSNTPHGAYPPEFELLWAQYPKRQPNNPKAPAFRAYSARLREKIDYQAMFDGTMRYAAYLNATGKIGTRYVKLASVFYGPDRYFAESWEVESANAHADPLGSSSVALKSDWLVKNGYASEDAA